MIALALVRVEVVVLALVYVEIVVLALVFKVVAWALVSEVIRVEEIVVEVEVKTLKENVSQPINL